MTLTLEFPQCLVSPLGRWDPRWKLAALLPAALALALLQSPLPALVALGAAILLVVAARMPLRWYFARLGVVALFLLLFLAWLPFDRDAGPHARLGPIVVSVPGTLLALTLLARALAMVTLLLVLLTTATIPDTFKAAHALRLPGLVVQLGLMTYRYVFLLGDEFQRLRVALRNRGFRNRTDLHSYRTIGQVSATLLIRGHERAERVAQAMRCRGFDGVFRSLHEFRTGAGDVLALAAVWGCAGAILAWDFASRN